MKRNQILCACFLIACAFSDSAKSDEGDGIQVLTIKNHRYSPEKLEVKAGQRFKLKIINEDATSEEFESKSMIIEKFIAPKKSITVNLGPLKPGEYEFFGCFHPDTAKGVLSAK
jgi:hypothetical protein